MILNGFLYATQYYRAPTPLSTEWENDIINMGKLGINTFQIRIQWRQNERVENVYNFDDVDELFRLAKLHNKKIIIKFMMENAPQYIFDKYDGGRKNYDETPLLQGTHGAFYIGGWMPCFDNDMVVSRAKLFVEKVVNRYKNEESLILYNVWNEPRSRPTMDCGCEYSKVKFRSFLLEEYGTIEDFNKFFGTAEESFESVPIPGMPHGYWDFYLYRKFKGSRALKNNLKFMYDEIKKYDKTRAIMSHVGGSACLQSDFYDCSDDFELAKAVDFYGTSYAVANTLASRDDEILCEYLLDFLRGVDENFVVHELYPDWGDWTNPVPPVDLRFKLWQILAHGSKGITYWQYRAERLGNENNLAGLVNMDGELNERSLESGEFAKVISENIELFSKTYVKPSEIAILYDANSAMMSHIEDCDSAMLHSFKPSDNKLSSYFNSMFGGYKLFTNMDLAVDFIDTREVYKINNYKCIFIPYGIMINCHKQLYSFAQHGGVLLLDEGFGLREQNTWLNVNQKPWEGVLQVKWNYRVLQDTCYCVNLASGNVAGAPIKTCYDVNGGDILATYDDGSVAIVSQDIGRGKVVIFGTSMGYSYNKYENSEWIEFMESIVDIQKIKYSNISKGIYARCLRTYRGDINFLFNRGDNEIHIPYDGKKILTNNSVVDGNIRVEYGAVLVFIDK